MQTQHSFTEKLLFDYYLVSSAREGAVASHFPFYLEEEIWLEMKDAALVLDGLVRKLIASCLQQKQAANACKQTCPALSLHLEPCSSSLSLHLEPFPYLTEIVDLQLPLLPFFWVRFDAFVKPNGGIFFSEFNYDKPCAQREILYNNLINPKGNPNLNFAAAFVKGLQELWASYMAETNRTKGVSNLTGSEPNLTGSEPYPTVGILVDPNHYEELHLAYLYQALLEPAGFTCVIAGGKNFRVANNQAYAFDQPVNIILRQYPIEHSQEIENFGHLLDLYVQGNLLLVNDPRSILGQGKALFATLWELVDSGSKLLTEQERTAIQSTIPRTWLYHSSWQKQLLARKDDFVLKGNYSRYSEEVYIGRLFEQSEWSELLLDLANSSKTHVVQEFFHSEPMVVRLVNDNYSQDTAAYGNFGIYLTNGRFSGLCARWSTDLLTADDSWFSPVGIRPTKLKLNNQWATQPDQRRQVWIETNDRAAFQLDYTGGYTAGRESFSLSCLEVKSSLKEELFQASESLLQIFSKVLDLVLAQPQLLCPVLGIRETLAQLVVQRHTNSLGLLGRLDWVLDQQGNPKLLEYNAETPAGLIESTGLQELIAELAWPQKCAQNPNQGLVQLIQAEFQRILQDFSLQREIKTIGFVSALANEDRYHTRHLMKCVQPLPYKFVYGEISGLRAKGSQLWLYDTPLDAIYRYYPLDWLEEFPGVLAALAQDTLSINPVHTFILQSKAFLALVEQLAEQGFFDPGEQELIFRYLPRTCLQPPNFKEAFVIKPYFAREGQGVVFSEDLQPGQLTEFFQQDIVFQERVFIQPLGLDVYSPQKAQHIPAYPVLGIFTVGDKAAGLYTRAGAKITDTEAIFLPAIIV